MNLRRITTDDISEVAAFAVRGLRPDLYPLHVSQAKVRGMVHHLALSQRDFQLAAFDDSGAMVGGIGVLRQELPWFERQEAVIVMFFATVAGVGRTLLQAAVEWFQADPMLRRLTWPLEADADVRAMLRYAGRQGFNSSNVNATLYKV